MVPHFEIDDEKQVNIAFTYPTTPTTLVALADFDDRTQKRKLVLVYHCLRVAKESEILSPIYITPLMMNNLKINCLRSIVLKKDVSVGDELFCDYGYLDDYHKVSMFKNTV